MSKPLHILIVEDSEDDALLLIRELRRGGFDPVSERVETPDAMRDSLEKRQWDIVISDYLMPRFSGLAALEIVRQSGLDLPVIIVSGNIGEDIAVGAMKAGAHDYIIKGNLARLVPAVQRELREAEARGQSRETDRRITVTTSLLELFTRKFTRKEYLDAAWASGAWTGRETCRSPPVPATATHSCKRRTICPWSGITASAPGSCGERPNRRTWPP
jgi:DNA-binding response OmpR family regulator